MKKRNYYRHEGYQQGFSDGKRTGGKINKKYVENLLQNETQHLSHEESQDCKMGWQDGCTDAINGLIKNMVLLENCWVSQVDELIITPKHLR
jgi:hypothetical protein